MRGVSLVALASFGAGAACGAVPAKVDGQASPERSSGGTLIERTVGTGADARRYLVYRPAARDEAERLPLVVMLHGCTQDALDFSAGSRMNSVAEERRAIIVYPEQPASAHPQKCWNWYDPAHQRRDAGEPASIAQVTRDAVREFRADSTRIYIAGISAGAAMAVLTAVSYPDLFAAVASHSGVEYRAATSIPQALSVMQQGGPPPSAQADSARAAMGGRGHLMPIIILHGSADAVVRPVNSQQLYEQWRQMQRATEGSGAREAREEEERGEANGYAYTRWRVRDGTGRLLVERWLVEGLGHKWSGGSEAGSYADPRGPDASRELLRFLLEHRRS